MESDKWETIRRLRYGALVKLFRHRWGYVLPDDDAGRGDLWELVTNVSLAPVAADKKMRCIIETWAPWMPSEEAENLVEHVGRLTNFNLAHTAQQIGQRLRLTNEERQRLKLWPFKPIDATDAELASQSRARRNARRKAQRAQTRDQYLSACLTVTKPWEAEGISRRTWERRRVASPGQTIVSRGETILATASVEERQKGIHEGDKVVRLSETMMAKEVDASGSSHLCHNLRQEQRGIVYAMLARDLAETDPRMAWLMAAHFVASYGDQSKAEAA